ncbi:MAG: hypothetical protein WAV32_01995 [Halobacteriota archaeon]
MKIGMMSTWNVPCGAAVHAELVGRSWIEKGHKLTVFAPLEEIKTREKDEPYVIRNYSKDYLNPEPFIEADYEAFVHHNISKMPMKELFDIFPRIKEKAKTVLIAHQGRILDDPYFAKFDWDAIVCFDERWKRFLVDIFPAEKIHIIPYPCHPICHGDKTEARRKLGLPEDKKIVLIYGISAHKYFSLLPRIARLNKKYPLILLVLTSVDDWFDLFEALKWRYKFIELRKEALSTEELYTYLHASDCLIYHSDSSRDAVLSSTVHLCMGAGRPILAHYSNFVEEFNTEVLNYGDVEEKLMDVFEDRESCKATLKAASEYVKRNSAEVIAQKFIQLFETLALEGE